MNTHKIISISLVLITVLHVSCKRDKKTASHEQSKRPAVTVKTVAVKSAKIPVYDEVVGTVRPHLEAQVASKVSGRILRMLAVPGMKVKKGEVLAEIEVEELKAALERSLADRGNANTELQRYRKLLASSAATQAEFDAVQTRQRMAEATVKESKIMISNARVVAPFDGTVTRKYMDTGDLATPARALFGLEDSSLLRLEIHVAESLANQVSLAEKFRVVVGGAIAHLEGIVAEISPSADPASRTFLVKLDLPKNEALRAGQFGRAFLPRSKRLALSVPAEALIDRGQMDYVFVADAGVARLRIVRTREEAVKLSVKTKDQETAAKVEILAGVEEGEEVVLSPPPELRDGQAITLEKSAATSENSVQKVK